MNVSRILMGTRHTAATHVTIQILMARMLSSKCEARQIGGLRRFTASRASGSCHTTYYRCLVFFRHHFKLFRSECVLPVASAISIRTEHATGISDRRNYKDSPVVSLEVYLVAWIEVHRFPALSSKRTQNVSLAQARANIHNTHTTEGLTRS